ncbi:MAG TPA: DEAD/DEAH box helicase [Gemmatimonadaceae bacterium]|nr:DEAD/DEAH box helicase [Gemmatimonadaceae bacterium]
MEQEGREVEGISRSQNAIYVMPHDWAAIARILSPLLERVDEGVQDAQLLIVATDAEAAAAISAAAAGVIGDRDVGVVAATSSRRAARILRARPRQVIVGTPDTLVELLRAAALKLENVRAVCIAWLDEIVTRGGSGALETLMADVPKESARTVVAAEITPAVEELLERYARRARREMAPVAETDAPVAVEYVTTSAQSRLAMLRRVLDEVDPKSALVFARENDGGAEVRGLLRALGYATDDAGVRVGLTGAPGTDLVVLYDLPTSREELRAVAAATTRTIAIVQPRQLASLRLLAAGGTLRPITMTEAGARVRDRDVKVRLELSAVLAGGQFGRELLALEPLLDDYDGVEIAAAALQLLEQERATHLAIAAGIAAIPRERTTAPMTRLFVNIGSRDGVRPADLVGAFANQGGAAGGDVGKVEVRESHSTVEVAATAADAIIEKMTGTAIRGRRAVVRRDEERPTRPAGSRDARDARGGPPSRGGRGGDAGGRGGPPRGPSRNRETSGRPSSPRSSSDRPRRGDRE